MTPLPNPARIVIRLDDEGRLQAVANNIAPTGEQLQVEVLWNEREFQDRSQGLPFNEDNLVEVTLDELLNS